MKIDLKLEEGDKEVKLVAYLSKEEEPKDKDAFLAYGRLMFITLWEKYKGV